MFDFVQSPEFSASDLENGRLLFARGTTFFKGVPSLQFLPEMERPEIAFAGRSNVGKSSLINALTNHHRLARTSNTPGRTRELNFFSVNDRINMVDMPGYGYARASKTDIASWQNLIKQYLQGRANLRRVYILVDSRHGIKLSDMELMEMLDESAVTYQVILTKADKIKISEAQNVYKNVYDAIKSRPAGYPFVGITSAEKKQGIDVLQTYIWNATEF